MSGFDRVMLYRFADNYEGEVISEAKAEHAESFLGLWYPASDIPEQARKLYQLNPIRNIVDVANACAASASFPRSIPTRTGPWIEDHKTTEQSPTLR